MKFYKEESNKWYVDLPDFPGTKAELEMVCGADTMLDIIGQGENIVHLTISDFAFPGAFTLEKIQDTPDIGGATYLLKEYKGIEYNLEMWLCEVTSYVFGYIPKTIYLG